MSKGVKTLCGLMVVALLMTGLPVSKTAGAQGGVGSEKRPGGGPGKGERPQERFVAGRLLVKFGDDVPFHRAQEAIAAHGGWSTEEIGNIGVRIIQLPHGASEQATLHAFQSQREVEFAELDRLVAPDAITPNDPWYVDQWHLTKISAPTAWSSTTGSSSVIVAILDTGVDGTHPDLASKMVPGWNIYNNNSDASDIGGHGTAVAGTAAAASNNNNGVASVAWGCMIMPIRISDTSGYALYSDMAKGLNWAADHGARVANISYGGSDSSTVKSAAQYFQSKGGVVTMSAGNSSSFNSSPDNPYVLTVSATDPNDVLASFSTTGNNVDLSAPGTIIRTTQRGGGYQAVGGTSFSSPIVAAVAALVMSANPGIAATQVQDMLKQSADDLGATGWDSSYGWGRVNAARAVAMAGGGTVDGTPPAVSITSPGDGVTVSGGVTVGVSASDNVDVTSVSLSVDGTALGKDISSPYTFQWDTSAMTNGSHTLTATASDAAGNSSSSSITVAVSNNVVADTTAPTVTITSPGGGATVSGNVSVYVTTSDNVGVVKNELYVDGVLTSTSATAPFTVKWNSRKARSGARTLQCRAYDAAGNAGLSQVVTVYK